MLIALVAVSLVAGALGFALVAVWLALRDQVREVFRLEAEGAAALDPNKIGVFAEDGTPLGTMGDLIREGLRARGVELMADPSRTVN
jgi:hypothetical protein